MSKCIASDYRKKWMKSQWAVPHAENLNNHIRQDSSNLLNPDQEQTQKLKLLSILELEQE